MRRFLFYQSDFLPPLSRPVRNVVWLMLYCSRTLQQRCWQQMCGAFQHGENEQNFFMWTNQGSFFFFFGFSLSKHEGLSGFLQRLNPKYNRTFI